MKNVYSILNEIRPCRTTVLLNHGNRGDGIILMGGRRLLDDHQISYHEIRYPEPASGKILLVYGCGAFSERFHHMVTYTRHYFDHFERIIILPASFQTSCPKVGEFLSTLPDKVEIFCREKYSYDLVQDCIRRKDTVYLDMDLAFYVDYSRWQRKGGGIAKSFRTDEEAPLAQLDEDNIDLSQGDETMGEALLKDISAFYEIHTNRAHVAIAAALMGKQTHLYPSTYHKQKGIYEYSLAHLKNVRWYDKLPNQQ